MPVLAQKAAEPMEEFSRKNTWTVFAEYSNTSSGILLGYTRERELADLGFGYTRRMFRFRDSTLSYHVELRPVMFESDPVAISTVTTAFQESPYGGAFTSTSVYAVVSPCQPSHTTVIYPVIGTPIYVYISNVNCGRQWTAAQAFSPVGLRYSIRTRHKVQPFGVFTAGYMYSSRPVPVSDAEAFNYVFDMGAGVEVFGSKRRSLSVECRYHHFSNADSAPANPGTDNMMYKLSYSFGR